MDVLNPLRESINENHYPPLGERINSLVRLRKEIQAHQEHIAAALKRDLGKPLSESWIEIGGVLSEIELFVKELPNWSLVEKVATPLVLQPGKSAIIHEPYGLVLILAPWNYPFQLALKPLIGAIAAGNRVVVKPSEFTPTVADVIQKIILSAFSPSEVVCYLGDATETQELLKEKFDFIFFTGSTQVGQLVMKAAAEHLTPVVLELGGKSPCIVDESAHIKQAARRIMWGKFTNAGQTCVAPDYVVVHESVKAELLHECKQTLLEFYGDDPATSPDFGRIVSQKHLARLVQKLSQVEIAHGGQTNTEERYLAPTLVDGVLWDHPLMDEEIFGPILPFITYSNWDQTIELIRKRPRPLALYLFSTNTRHQEEVQYKISYGGGCLNDTIVHLGNHHLPFGGVGASGMGAYHGKYSFEVFSHRKAIFQQTTLVDIPVRYPPYSGKEKLIKFLLG